MVQNGSETSTKLNIISAQSDSEDNAFLHRSAQEATTPAAAATTSSGDRGLICPFSITTTLNIVTAVLNKAEELLTDQIHSKTSVFTGHSLPEAPHNFNSGLARAETCLQIHTSFSARSWEVRQHPKCLECLESTVCGRWLRPGLPSGLGCYMAAVEGTLKLHPHYNILTLNMQHVPESCLSAHASKWVIFSRIQAALGLVNLTRSSLYFSYLLSWKSSSKQRFLKHAQRQTKRIGLFIDRMAENVFSSYTTRQTDSSPPFSCLIFNSPKN